MRKHNERNDRFIDKRTPLMAHRKHTPEKPVRGATMPAVQSATETRQTIPPQETPSEGRKMPCGYVLDVYNALLNQQADAAYAEAMEAAQPETDTDDADLDGNAACAAAVREGNEQNVVSPSRHDVVNHPSHYCQGGIECIDAIQAAVTGLSGMEAVCTGNVIKYVWRAQYKNGLEDLRKARFYLNKLILLTERKDRNA